MGKIVEGVFEGCALSHEIIEEITFKNYIQSSNERKIKEELIINRINKGKIIQLPVTRGMVQGLRM